MSSEVVPTIKHDTPDVKPKPRPPKFRYWSFESNKLTSKPVVTQKHQDVNVKYKKEEMPLPDEMFSKESIRKDIARHAPGYRACGYAAVIRDGNIYFSYRAVAE